MILIPVGSETHGERFIPWATIVLIAANIIVFFAFGSSSSSRFARVEQQFEMVIEYWMEHPYLHVPPEFLAESNRDASPEVEAMLIRQMLSLPKADMMVAKDFQQRELNERVESYLRVHREYRSSTLGLVPNDVRALKVFTSMFMHAGWLHLLGNLLWLWVTAPFLENAFGRIVFIPLYLIGGALAAFMHVGAEPGSGIPLIGASGAIAGLMGAYLVRFGDRKIKFFYWIIVLFGTFRLPAWVTLAFWFALQIALVSLVGAASGVAYWAHIGGFGFGMAVAYSLQLADFERRFRPTATNAQELHEFDLKDLNAGMRSLESGQYDAAITEFNRVLQYRANQREALLGLWQANVAKGTPDGAKAQLIRLIGEEIRSGDTLLAFDHWHELKDQTGEVGPASLRLRLGLSLARESCDQAVEVLTTVAGDSQAGEAAVKAARKLSEIVEDEPQREYWRRLAAASRGAVNQSGPPDNTPPPVPASAAPPGIPLSAPPDEPMEISRIGVATVPNVVAARLCNVSADGLDVFTTELERVPTACISKVFVGAIADKPRPYIVVDLLEHSIERPEPRIVRLNSRSMDPVGLTNRPDLKPMDAFIHMVASVAHSANARLVPDSVVDGTIPQFESLDSYEQLVVQSSV